jgi:prophage antirepressor-like protein
MLDHPFYLAFQAVGIDVARVLEYANPSKAVYQKGLDFIRRLLTKSNLVEISAII